MADVTLPVTVTAGVNAKTRQVALGSTVVAGRCLHLAADNLHDYAEANSSLLISTVVGISIGGGDVGQHCLIIEEGLLNNCSGLTRGVTYMLADTIATGVLMPVADQAASDWVTLIGVAISATVLEVGIINSGIQQ